VATAPCAESHKKQGKTVTEIKSAAMLTELVR
jgi:hypothetical protein